MYSFLLTTRSDLKNTGSLTPYSLTASHNIIFAGNLVLRINLTSCCWVIFRLLITMLLPLTAFNRAIYICGSILQRKVLRQELQPRFDDGLLTFFGFRWTPLFVKYFLRVLWWTWIFRPNSRYDFALQTYVCFFKRALVMEDERAHFWPQPIFLSIFSCFSNLWIVR
jgi:hypothetical protein